MVLRIFKIIATSGFLTASECTEFVFGQGSTRTLLRELPRPRSWFKGPYFYGGGAVDRIGEGKRKGRERNGGGTGLLSQIP